MERSATSTKLIINVLFACKAPFSASKLYSLIKMTEMRAIRACAQVVDVPENIQASEANVRQVSDKANTEILQQQEEKQYPLPKYLSKDLFSQWYCVYYLQVPVPTSEYMKTHRPLLKLRSKRFHATYLLLSVSSRVGFSFNFALREATL